MAINLTPDPAKGWKTLSLFNVDPNLIKQAKDLGIVCVTTSPGIYTIKNKSQVFGNIPVKPTALSLVEQKSLGPGSVEQYKFSFEASLKKAIAGTPKVGGIAAAAEADDSIPEVPKTPKAPKKKAEMPEIKPKYDPWGNLAIQHNYDPDDDLPKGSSPPAGVVSLKDATKLYQKVHGTNKNSIYHTFALFPGMNLAVRVQGTKMSVRAEGTELSKYTPMLTAHFKMDNNQTYCSAHYVVKEGKDLMIKTLAAIVGVLGFDKVLKVANLNDFIDGAAS